MDSKKIGRYEIKGILGEGGMATVYLAYDPHFERDVALKMLHEHTLQDKDSLARFRSEGKFVARLDHPHIVPVYDIGEEEGKPYLVMRYMAGGSLRNWIKRGALSLAQATKVLEQISGALDEAHEHGIIHRDIKPGNIMLDQRGDIFLSDFGIVKNLDAQTKFTMSGAVIGTAAYMSSEQCAGKEVNSRSDIYALGVVLYEMLTGQLPFEEDSFFALLQAHIKNPIPYLSEIRADLPIACQLIVEKALAKNPEERYVTAAEMYQDLKMVLVNSGEALNKESLFQPPILATAETRYDPPISPDDASGEAVEKEQPQPANRLTTSEKIRVQLKRLPIWARAGIVGVGLIVLFSILYQVWAAPPGTPEPTATVELMAVITDLPETDVPPSETPALMAVEPSPTAVYDSLIVRDWDSNAIWQANDEINRIPEDGEIPLVSLPILIQANDSPMELLLPDRTRLVLDSNTSISLDAVEKGRETAVTLEKGRLGIEPMGLSVAITAPTGVQAHISAGLMGVTYDPERETFDIDCLEGICTLDMPGEENIIYLNAGEKRRAAQGYVLESESAQFEAFLNLFNRLPTTTPAATFTPTFTETPTATASRPPRPAGGDGVPYEFVIGQSVTGRNLNMMQFGRGARKFVLVGGTHAGYAPNTVALAEEFIAYYTNNPEAVPSDVTLFIITNLNPDAPAAPAALAGRLNANGVDLNRNWDCRWTENPIILGSQETGAGGTTVESEPEVQALANFIRQQSPTAVIQLAAHGRNYGTASPGSCINSSRVSVSLSKLYGNAAGYLFPDADNDGLVEPDARLTGDMSNWLDSVAIPAISILLTRYENTDFESNLAGLTAVLENYTAPDTPATISPIVVTEQTCSETAVISESVYPRHQDKLGCAQSSIKQPDGAVQQFENGIMIWRGDTDNIYLLYDDGSLASYVVKETSDYGATEMLKGGFGYVWHTKPGVSSKIGEPEESEHVADQFRVQDFENGTILTYDGAGGYKVLFHNSNQWKPDS